MVRKAYYSFSTPIRYGKSSDTRLVSVHGNLTPAGFATGSVEKYHYALHRSSPIGCFPGYRRINVVARFLSAGLGASAASARNTGNVSDACVFSFEGACDPHIGIIHSREGVDFIPSNNDLFGVEVALNGAVNREYVLKGIVDALKDEYDYILIDCLPSLGLMVINALVAADSVIIPSHPAFLSTRGLSQLFRTINKVKRTINQHLMIDGILITCADIHTRNAKEVIESLRNTLGKRIRIYDTVIPRSVKVAECSLMGKSIYRHNPSGKVAEAYEDLVDEVIEYGYETTVAD